MKKLNPLRLKRCIRCGTCCKKGGPVLHLNDLELLLKGYIGYQHLVTIREGEPTYSPYNDRPVHVARELIKIGGRSRDWACPFLITAGKSSCSIYDSRPLECRLQKCWDASELLAVVGKDTIVRTDIINPGDEILKLIAIHERECSYLKVKELVAAFSVNVDAKGGLAELTRLVQQDMAIRWQALAEFGLDEEWELFVFGRPLFKIIEAYGFMPYEENGKIHLELRQSLNMSAGHERD